MGKKKRQMLRPSIDDDAQSERAAEVQLASIYKSTD